MRWFTRNYRFWIGYLGLLIFILSVVDFALESDSLNWIQRVYHG